METIKKYLPSLTRTFVIAFLYAAATLICVFVAGQYSWGPVQVRLSEVACVLALFTPEAILGLGFGCMVANVINLTISNLGTFTPVGLVVCLALPIAGAIFAKRFRERPYIASVVLLVVNVAAVLIFHALFGTIGVLDVILGSLATTLGALFTWKYHERPALAVLGPVIANAIIIPTYLPFMLEGMDMYVIPFTNIALDSSYWVMYLFGFVGVALGEAIVLYVLGLPLARLIKNTRFVAWLEQGHEAYKELGAEVQRAKAEAIEAATAAKAAKSAKGAE